MKRFIILIAIALILVVFPVGAGSVFQDSSLSGGYSISLSTYSQSIPNFSVTAISSPAYSFASVSESSVLIDPHNSSIIDNWYVVTNGGRVVNYRNTTDMGLTSWNSAVQTNIPAGAGWFPYVTYYAATDRWYMFSCRQSGSSYDMYLWSSTDKISWTALNGGNPVLTHNADAASKYYYVFNPAIYITGTKFNMLFEADTQAGADNQAALLYTYSDLTELNWTAHINSTPVIPLHGNPDLTYVPGKRMLMCTSGNSSSGLWDIDTFYSDISSGFSDLTKWTRDDNKFVISDSGIHDADPTVIIMNRTPMTTTAAIVYGYNQGAGNYVEFVRIS